jgi:hypothetical protein
MAFAAGAVDNASPIAPNPATRVAKIRRLLRLTRSLLSAPPTRSNCFKLIPSVNLSLVSRLARRPIVPILTS